jgi:hypothetical protein
VPDAVTTAVLDYCRMLTAHRIPVFKFTMLGTFRRLVDGTPMVEKSFRSTATRAAAAWRAAWAAAAARGT